jgi:hypothetical protein
VSELFRILSKKAFRDLYVGMLKAEMLQWAGSAGRVTNRRSVYKRVSWEQ